MIPDGVDVPALAWTDDMRVDLVPLEMGELTMYASLPELPLGEGAAGGKRTITAVLGAGAGPVEADFSGYYSLEPSAPAGARRRRQAIQRRAARPARASRSPGRRAGAPGASSPVPRWRPWPWRPELNPFPLLVHSVRDGRDQGSACLVAGDLIGTVTPEDLGAQLARLSQLSTEVRPVEDPVVLVTCTQGGYQAVANATGRLLVFPRDSEVALASWPAGRGDSTDRAGLVLIGDGIRNGFFTSAYPQGAAGDRVRLAYRERFPGSARDWLVARSARSGDTAPAGARPLVFGDGLFLAYLDQRDQDSRAAVLGSAGLSATYGLWTADDAYQPGAAAGTGQARPFHWRELGRLPVSPKDTAAAFTYYAGGRLAVYDKRSDLTYWEEPLEFGQRLRRDLRAAVAGQPAPGGMPEHVLLLTDFSAVPGWARADIARGLGAELITADAPATMSLDEESGLAGIALVPGAGGVTRPEWTSTTPAGAATGLGAPARGQPGPARRRAAVPSWEELERLARQTAARIPQGADVGRLDAAPGLVTGRCVALAMEWRDALFPGGIAPAGAVDDDHLAGRRGLLAGLVPAGGWLPVASSRQVQRMLTGKSWEQDADAVYAMVAWEPAGQLAGVHGKVWHAHRGPDDRVRWMDLEAGGGQWVGPGGPAGFARGFARAVFISPEGRVLTPRERPVPALASVQALLELAPARPVTGNGDTPDGKGSPRPEEHGDPAGRTGTGTGRVARLVEFYERLPEGGEERGPARDAGSAAPQEDLTPVSPGDGSTVGEPSETHRPARKPRGRRRPVRRQRVKRLARQRAAREQLAKDVEQRELPAGLEALELDGSGQAAASPAGQEPASTPVPSAKGKAPVRPGDQAEADPEPVAARRARLRSLIGVLAASGQRLLDGLGDDRAPRQMAAIFAELDQLALKADSAERLAVLNATVGAQVAALEMVRLERLRRGLPSAHTGRPQWYEELLGRAEALWPKLAALPSEARPMPARSGAGPVAVGEQQVLPEARRRLADAVDGIWRAYYLAAAQAAAMADAGPGDPGSTVATPLVITDRDPLAADPGEGPARAAVVALRESRDRLDSLVTEVEDLLSAIVATAVHEVPATLPPAGAKPKDLPDRDGFLEKFDPPHHLAAVEPVLGTDTVMEISPAVIDSIRQQVLEALPPRMRDTPEKQARVRELIVGETGPKELMRVSPELIGSWHVLEIDGARVEVRVRPLRGRQVSNAIAARPKTMENLRGYLDLARNRGHFSDINFNWAYARDTVRGTFPVQMTGTEAFMGLLTLVLSEHSETVNSRMVTTRERTIKNSSYASYLFSYTARVEVRLPGAAPPADADVRPQFHDGLRIVSGREALPPRQDALGNEDLMAVAVSRAVHESAANRAPLLHPPGERYSLPDNAGIEALNAAAEIREQVQEYAAKLAPPGTWERRQLDAQLTMRALKLKLPQASTLMGAEIRFGGPDTGSQHWVRWRVELVPVRVPVLLDAGTWMDLDDREHRGYGVAKVVEDAIDIPPGVMFYAVPLNLLRLDWLEPFLFAWPSLDAEHSRSGAGMTATRTVGIRYMGELTSVIQLRATLRLSTSGRGAPEYRPRQLRGPVFARQLTKHVRGRVADVPVAPNEPGGANRPAPEVRAPDNIWASSLAHVTDLTGTDRVHESAVDILLEHFAGFLPGPGRDDSMIRFLPRWLNLANKFAAHNEQALRTFAEGLRANANARKALGSRGHSVRILKADGFGFRTEVAVVRVQLRQGYFNEAGEWVPAGPQPAAWLPDSELDANYTEEQDTLASRARITGAWAGLQVVTGIGTAASGALAGVEARPMAHGRWVAVKGAYTGLASWALHGFPIDDLHAFRGPVTLFLSVEEDQDRPLSRRRPSSSGWDLPGVLLMMLHVALLVAINPELTLAEALLILGPQVAHWLGPRVLGAAGAAGRALEEFTGTVPGPVNGPRHSMRPVIQPVDEAQVISATGAAPAAGPGAEVRLRGTPPGGPGTAAHAGDTGPRGPRDAGSPAGAAGQGEAVIEMPAPEPAQGRRVRALPVRASYEVILPTSMTSRRITGPDGAGQWVPYDYGRTDERGRNTGVGPEPLVFEATEERRFPPHLFVEAQGDGVVDAIYEAFAEMGFTRLPRDSRARVESAVAAAQGSSVTLREAREPLPVWEGEIAQPAATDAALTGHAIMGRVKLRMVVDRAETIGLPESYSTYNDHGLVAVAGAFTEKTGWPLAGWNPLKSWSQFLGLRIRLPVHAGTQYPNRTPASNFDPAANTLFTITPQPQQFHRLERAAGEAVELGASAGRMGLEISPLAIAHADLRWEIVVQTWHTRYLTGEFDRQEVKLEVPDTGHSVLASSDATSLGLMPEGLRLELDQSVRYRIPDHQENVLGAEAVARPPDFTDFVDEVLAEVERRLGAKARELVAEEIGKVTGGYTSAAFLAELSNGGVPITVPFPDKYEMPLPGGRHVGTLRATRLIRIVLKARLDGQEFMGVVPTRHYLGFRTGVERYQELFRARMARLGADLVRIWNFFDLDHQAVNAIWNNSVWSKYGQTARRERVDEWAEDSTGTVTDTARSGPAQPAGPAQFMRKVIPSAEVSVGTAPAAMLDAAVAGAAQTWQRFPVPENVRTATTIVTRHDTYTLDREGTVPRPAPALPAAAVSAPPARPAAALLAPARPGPGHELPGPATAPAGPGGQLRWRLVRPAPARLPAWEPRRPSVTLQKLGRADDFAALRRGLKVPEGLLAEAQARHPGQLAGLSGKLSQLLLPLAAAYETEPARQGEAWLEYLASVPGSVQRLWRNLPAVWANYVSRPQAGASLYHPQGLPLDYADLLAGNTYLTGTLRQQLTGAAAVEIVLPGRIQWPTVTLEHLADVEYVHVTGRETPNQMLKLFNATADSVGHQVEVLSGTLWQHWTEIAGQLRGTAYDFGNDLGPLIDIDHITWNTFLAASRERYGHDIGLKRTHLGMAQVFLGARYTYGINPYEPAKGITELSRYWPGPRQYFRDDEIRWAELWVPATQKHIWEALSRSLWARAGAGRQPGPPRAPAG